MVLQYGKQFQLSSTSISALRGVNSRTSFGTRGPMCRILSAYTPSSILGSVASELLTLGVRAQEVE